MQAHLSYNRWSYDLLAWGGALVLHALLLGIHFRSPDLHLRLSQSPEPPVSMAVSLTASALASTQMPPAVSPPEQASTATASPPALPPPPVVSPPLSKTSPPLPAPSKAAAVVPPSPTAAPPGPPPVPVPAAPQASSGTQASPATGMVGSSSETGDAIPAQVTQKGIPIYPKAALNEGASGHIEVEVSLSPFGAITDVKVLQSTGHRSLDKAFISAIRTHYHFTPKRVLGVPVASTMRLEHRFELD